MSAEGQFLYRSLDVYDIIAGRRSERRSVAGDAESMMGVLATVLELLSRVPSKDRKEAAAKLGKRLPAPLHTILAVKSPADAVQGPLKLPPAFRARFDAAVKGMGGQMLHADLIREGISRVVQEFEAIGGIRFGLSYVPPASAPIKPDAVGSWEAIDVSEWSEAEILSLKTRARKARKTPGQFLMRLARPFLPTPAPLTLKARDERLIREAATMLEIKPQTFLNWRLSAFAQELFEEGGLLGCYAMRDIEYDPETEKRVRARFLKWERRTFGKNLNYEEGAQS